MPDQPPVLDLIGDRTAHPNTNLTFFAHATDPQGRLLQYSLINAPAGATINQLSGQFNWTPAWNQVASWTLTVRATATAGDRLSAQQSFTVSVVNQGGPVITGVTDKTAHPGRLLSFPINAADPDGDIPQ